MDAASTVIGREHILAQCQTHLATSGGVLLHGPAGIGKSTLLGALSGSADDLVLSTSPVAAEARLPYVALFDLFGRYLPAADRLLPRHLATALRVALLHDSPALHAGVNQLCLRIAVVELLRAISGEQPVLLVVDDAQWIDPPSAEVLAFAARRLSGTRVGMLVAERVTDDGEPRFLHLCKAPAVGVALDGMPEAEMDVLLRRRLDLRLHASVLSRVATASGGNPLFFLELGRALAGHHGSLQSDEPVPVPRRLRDLLADRLGALTAESQPMLLMFAAGGPAPDGPVADAALAAGVLTRRMDARIDFSHPLLSELVYADATETQRRAAHAGIAALTDDPVASARHRALATREPDASLASALDEAAVIACLRGAPSLAAELSRLAADRTPADPALAARRLLDAARSSHAAGQYAQANADCLRALPDADAEGRVAARLLQVDLHPESDGASTLLDEAAHDAADDPRLTARVHLHRANVAMHAGDVPGCLAALEQAESLAAREPDLLVAILSIRGPIELFTDGPRAMRTFEKGARIAADRPLTEAAVYVRAGLAAARLRQGDAAEAVRSLEHLRAEVEQTGRLLELGTVMHLLTGAYERAGLCREAYLVGRSGARLREDVEPNAGRGLLLRGMAELNGGTAAEAATVLEAAVAALEAARLTESHAYAAGLLGRARFLLGDVFTAATWLARSRTLLDGIGYSDPGLFLVDADLVEALALSGATERASDALVESRARARRPDRIVIQLGLDRAGAVLEAVRGNAHHAAATLRGALDRAAGHPYPLEVARGWLTLGRIEAQSRRQAAARRALAEAVKRYSVLGCQPWWRYAQTALAELDQIDQPATEVEQRIIALVRLGATNKQIARTLHLSVKTVEAHLTRTYRKRGVRNRAELLSERTPA